MDHARQRRLNSGMGVKVRNFFESALQDADRLPTKSALKARIEAEFGDVPGIDLVKLEETWISYATKAQRGPDGTVDRFSLRSHVIELTDQLVDRLDRADRIIEHKEPEPVDVKAAAASAQGTDTNTARMLASIEDSLRQNEVRNR